MADINVTRFVCEAELADISGSIAERGPSAGPETWANAMADAKDRNPPILSEGDIPAFRDHMAGYGAWDAEEIASWSPQECNALMAQLVAGDMRELEALHPGDGPGGVDWEAAREDQEEGRISSSISCDGESIWYYLGD